jgi:hypothetical protein
MPAMPRPPRSVLFLILLLALVPGCHHGGQAPAGWVGKPIGADRDTADKDAGQATLQVFICYGKVFSNHSALRLTAPGKPTLMWDPGGTFLQYDLTKARRHDVITRNAPTVNEWWRYRRDGCLEPVMEVFQWSLDTPQARRLHAVLTDYQDPANPTETFEPDGGGLQCSKKVSEYLMRFAGDRPRVQTQWFWPHKLAERLWTQSPDHVWVFRRDGPAYVYRRAIDSDTGEQQNNPDDRDRGAGDGAQADPLAQQRDDRQHE